MLTKAENYYYSTKGYRQAVKRGIRVPKRKYKRKQTRAAQRATQKELKKRSKPLSAAQKRGQLLTRLIDRYGAICWYCGKEFTDSIHIDHIIPRASKGSDKIDNRALACSFCNHAKWDKPVKEFLEWLSYVRNSDFIPKVE